MEMIIIICNLIFYYFTYINIRNNIIHIRKCEVSYGSTGILNTLAIYYQQQIRPVLHRSS